MVIFCINFHLRVCLPNNFFNLQFKYILCTFFFHSHRRCRFPSNLLFAAVMSSDEIFCMFEFFNVLIDRSSTFLIAYRVATPYDSLTKKLSSSSWSAVCFWTHKKNEKTFSALFGGYFFIVVRRSRKKHGEMLDRKNKRESEEKESVFV